MIEIILVAVALALDAFGVALGIGCGTQMKLKEKVALVFSFGFFQFFFALVGAGLGNYIDQNLFNISGYISGIIILLIGLLLLWEGHKDDEACIYVNLNFWAYIVLGVSVSIDALGIGFSALYNLNIALVFANTLIIGIITAGLTVISFAVVKYIKNFLLIEKYADYIGGSVLIIWGLNMII